MPCEAQWIEAGILAQGKQGSQSTFQQVAGLVAAEKAERGQAEKGTGVIRLV